MKRYRNNPVISRADIPPIAPQLVDVSAVFNPGAIQFNCKFLLILRVQNRARETFFLRADSDDGKQFVVQPQMIHFDGIERLPEPIYQCYDARITKIENQY